MVGGWSSSSVLEARVGGDPHDGHPGVRFAPGPAGARPQRTAVRKEPAHEGLVDHADPGRGGGVLVVDAAPEPERSSHRGKIAGTDLVRVDLRLRPFGHRCLALHDHVVHHAPSGQGQLAHQAGRRRARSGAQPLVESRQERLLGGDRFITRRRQRQPECQDTPGLESQGHVPQLPEAPDQQAGPDQQHRREGELGDDQRAPQRRPAFRGARAGEVRLAGLPQVQGGGHAEHQAGGK